MKIRAETVFCDDVRLENTGKHILIGVYGSDIVPGVMPANLGISLWTRVYGLAKGKHHFHMVLSGPTGRSKFEATGDTDITSSDAPAVFAMAGLPVEVPSAGEITVTYAFDGGPTIEAGKIRVLAPPQAG
ncbi:hypothetical protein PZ895_07830 [Mesorhizobium sp. YIM 152430]|uniref:DUF6941 family protein n=1 Tax=Mesorhizobium sp. YIM 152430 TaxID=3031761 RepID=UPI0023DC73CB|nr:hypothetical protein [Mesorhizobium sp. YIM 152430]MDF1599684.1 hypothetical protein [Mesorhizobium sp. YIM 152430]